MACCKACCGCKDCEEGEEGKCCCGGQPGECCQVGEYCCSGVCQESPCSPCDAPCAEDCFFEQPGDLSPCDYAWGYWAGTPPMDFEWKTGYPDALDGCTYAWVTVRARSAEKGLVNGSADSACWKVKFRHSLIVCDGETLRDITNQAITVTCSPSATSGSPVFGCSINAGDGCRSGEYCFGSPFNPNGTGAVGLDCAECSAASPTGDVDFLPDIVCDP